MDGVVWKNGILATLAVVGTALAEALGGVDALLEVLVALMVADCVGHTEWLGVDILTDIFSSYARKIFVNTPSIAADFLHI